MSLVSATNEQRRRKFNVLKPVGSYIGASLPRFPSRHAHAVFVASALLATSATAQHDSSTVAGIRAAATAAISHVNWCKVFAAVERETKRGPSSAVTVVKEIAIDHVAFWSEPSGGAELVHFDSARLSLTRACRTLTGPVLVSARDAKRLIESGLSVVSVSVTATPRLGGRGWNIDTELTSGNRVAHQAQLRVRRFGSVWRVVRSSETYDF